MAPCKEFKVARIVFVQSSRSHGNNRPTSKDNSKQTTPGTSSSKKQQPQQLKCKANRPITSPYSRSQLDINYYKAH
jgi:hypothetical protein